MWPCAFCISASQMPHFGRVACFFQPFVYNLKVLYLLQEVLLWVVFHQTYDICARFHLNISHTFSSFRQYLQLNFAWWGQRTTCFDLGHLRMFMHQVTMVLAMTHFAQLQSKRIWKFDCLLKSRFLLALFGNKRHWTNAKKLQNTDFNSDFSGLNTCLFHASEDSLDPADVPHLGLSCCGLNPWATRCHKFSTTALISRPYVPELTFDAAEQSRTWLDHSSCDRWSGKPAVVKKSKHQEPEARILPSSPTSQKHYEWKGHAVMQVS